MRNEHPELLNRADMATNAQQY